MENSNILTSANYYNIPLFGSHCLENQSIVVPIHIDLYGYTIIVIYNTTKEDFLKALEDLSISIPDEIDYVCKNLFDISKSNDYGKYIHLYNENYSFLMISKFPNTPSSIGILMHEIFHATTFILDKIGMKLKLLKSDEAYAYLQQYITTEIFNVINIIYNSNEKESSNEELTFFDNNENEK